MMYRMSPLNSPSEAVPCKSDVMYELKSYHSQDVVDINDNLHVQNGVAQEDDSLELRQSKVIDRLQNLKKTLEDLTSCEKKAALNAAEVKGLEKDRKFSSESLVFAGLSHHQMSPTIQTTPVPELHLKLEEFVQNVVEKKLLDNMQDISVQLPIGQPHSWIIVLRQLLNDRCFPKMQVSTFYHSSVPQAQIDSSSPSWVLSSNSNVKFRILWRQEFLGPAMCFSPSVPLLIGLSSVSKAIGCVLGIYPASDQPINRVREDYWIDVAASIQASNKKLRQAAIKELNVALGNSKSKFLLGDRAGLCDIILFTCLSDLKLIDCPPSNVAKWKDTCKALGIQLQ